MKTPFPLFARLLVWLFVNFLLLLAGVGVMIRVEFGSMENLLLPPSVQSQIQDLSVTLVSELSRSPRTQWDGILDQFSRANKMEFALFDIRAQRIAGAPLETPEEVKNHMRFAIQKPPAQQEEPGMSPPWINPSIAPPLMPPGQPPPLPGGPPPGPGPEGGPGPESGPSHGRNMPAFPRDVVHTPSGYWLLERLPPEPLHQTEPTTLVGMTPALGITPLLFNPKPWFAMAAAAILFSVLFWFPLAHNLTTAIARITLATETIAQGQFDIELSENRRDELGRLAGAINRMTSRLKNFVTGQKRFLGDAAHELCSPLVRMEMALALLESRADESSRDLVQDVKEELVRMRELVNELLNFSKASLGESQEPLVPLNLHETVLAAVARETTDPAAVIVEIDPALQVIGNRKLLVRAVGNLVRNALRYAGESGPIIIAAQYESREVLLTITDQGPGVPAAELEKLFDPFYRVDTSRTSETGGVGLGLAIVKSCVEACRGTVTARNHSPTGLQVQVRLQAS